MKLKLLVSKNGKPLCESIREIGDARSFSDAFADVWVKLVERKLGSAPSVGAVYELLGDKELPDLRDVEIRIVQADP